MGLAETSIHDESDSWTAEMSVPNDLAVRRRQGIRRLVYVAITWAFVIGSFAFGMLMIQEFSMLNR